MSKVQNNPAHLITQLFPQTPRLLRVLLWLATFRHLGLMLWSMLFVANLPPSLHPSLAWAAYVSPLGANPQSFHLYLFALILNLVWESLSNSANPPQLKALFMKMGLGDRVLLFWVLLEGAVALAMNTGLSPETPRYLHSTLIACFLLWAIQKGCQWYGLRPLAKTQFVEAPKAGKTNRGVDKPKASHQGRQAGQPSGPAQPKPAFRLEASTRAQPALQPLRLAPSKPVAVAAPQSDSPAARLTQNKERLLDFIRSHGQAKTGEMVQALGIHVRSISRLLQSLMDEGQVISTGKGRWTKYRIKEKADGGEKGQNPQARRDEGK